MFWAATATTTTTVTSERKLDIACAFLFEVRR